MLRRCDDKTGEAPPASATVGLDLDADYPTGTRIVRSRWHTAGTHGAETCNGTHGHWDATALLLRPDLTLVIEAEDAVAGRRLLYRVTVANHAY